MGHYYDEKVTIINNYIQQLDEIILAKDSDRAEKLEDEIIAVFSTEIDHITRQLSSYSYGDKVDYVEDAKILKAKLINYRINLTSGLIRLLRQDEGINLTQNISQEASLNLAISLSNTVTCINSLPSSILSDKEKETLGEKLAGIEAETDKSKRWERIGNTLRWIADKSVEVGVAALPYIVQALTK